MSSSHEASYLAVEVDGHSVLRPGLLPGVAVAQPVVRLLALLELVDLLREDPVLVPDAVTVAGQCNAVSIRVLWIFLSKSKHGLPRHGEGGHAVQEAGSQSAQTAVAEPGVALHFLHLFHVQTELKIIT